MGKHEYCPFSTANLDPSTSAKSQGGLCIGQILLRTGQWKRLIAHDHLGLLCRASLGGAMLPLEQLLSHHDCYDGMLGLPCSTNATNPNQPTQPTPLPWHCSPVSPSRHLPPMRFAAPLHAALGRTWAVHLGPSCSKRDPPATGCSLAGKPLDWIIENG